MSTIRGRVPYWKMGRYSALLVSVVGSLALLGCRSKNSGGYTYVDSPVVEEARPASAFVPTPAVPKSQPVPREAPLPGEPVFTGLDPAQLDLFFRPETAEVKSPAVTAPVKPERIQADAAWNVPLKVKWRHIVIHHSASARGSSASFHREHLKRGWDGLGYHFVIGNGTGSRDGEVEVGYRWRRQARGAHAGNKEFNVYGIGICLVGNFDEGRPTGRQMASLRSLIGFLRWKAKIPAARIIGHGDVPHKDTRCPGRYFDVVGFRSSLGSGALRPALNSSGSTTKKMVSRTMTNGSATP